MIHSIQTLFYGSIFSLILVCIVTANNMSKHTCACMRHCLKAILIGLVCLAMAFYYELEAEWLMLSCVPILFGVSGWLLFDKYRAHEDIDAFLNKIHEVWQKYRLNNE